MVTVERVWEILRGIPDPEIPALSLVDLRVIRNVSVEVDCISVVLRPTFSGCPALHHMKEQVESTLSSLNQGAVRVTIDHTSSWSTDDLTDLTRKKLSAFGIAPPPHGASDIETALAAPVECPHCGSLRTRLDSPFGPTLCKQLFVCDDCRHPFERFKPL